MVSKKESSTSLTSKKSILLIKVPTLVLLILLYASCGGNEQANTEAVISEESFPQGGSGLNDSDAKADQLQALGTGTSSGTDEISPEPTPVSPPEEDLPVVSYQTSPATTPDSHPSQLLKDPALPFKQVLSDIDNPSNIVSSNDGTVWISHRRGVVEITNGLLKNTKHILTKERYISEIATPNDLNEIPRSTSLTIDSKNRLWLGFDAGQLLRFDNNKWHIISRQRRSIKTNIKALLSYKDDIYIASNGLFKWESNFRRLLSDPKFRNKRVHSFAVSKEGQLYMGARFGLYLFNNDAEQTWTKFWSAPKDIKGIYSIHILADGNILLGTTNGLLIVSKRGLVIERSLPGHKVESITPGAKGELWARSSKSGLVYFDGSKWYASGSKKGSLGRVSSLLIDSRNRLWLAVSKKGVFLTGVPAARKWMKNFPLTSAAEFKPQSFANACRAAEKLIKGISVSRNIATIRSGELHYVFINGKQVCPKGIGHFTSDGEIVLVRRDAIVVYRKGESTQIKIPENVAPKQITTIYLDSKKRIWLGTKTEGVFQNKENQKEWQQYSAQLGLANNPLTAILEDLSGNIWLASTPPLNPETKSYNLSSLHLNNDKGWFHYNDKHGLLFNGAQSLALNNAGNLLVATRKGVSVIDNKAMITNYGPPQGIIPSFAASTSVDRQGRIWFAHQFYGDGVSWTDGKNVYRMDGKSGLFDKRISTIGFDAEKRVWLVAASGATSVYPLEFLEAKAEVRALVGRALKAQSMFQR